MASNPITPSLSSFNPKVLLCAIACLGAAANAGETAEDRSSASETENSHRAGKDFWSFQPITRPSPPAVQDSQWPATGIDQFILSAQQRHGLSPVSDAPATTLLRRIYFDLVGLPPSPAKIRAFLEAVRKNRDEAIAAVVDNLLSSPDFGVKWARHWLDIARYSESTGGGRTLLFGEAWRYRDYVVNSLNSDKPYDRFIREQIAGDLLAGGSLEERQQALIATGFLLLGPTNYELQDKTVLEMDIIDELLDTLGKAFLGLTIGCARCHDHKFDPIDSGDYYGMAGILKGTKVVIHSNVSTWNKRPLPLSPEQEHLHKQQAARIKTLQQEISLLSNKKTKASIPLSSLPGIVVDDENAQRKGEWTRSTSNSGYVAANYLHDGATGKGEKEVRYRAGIPGDGKFEVRISYTEGTNRDRKVPVVVRHADGEKTIYVDQTRRPPIDGSFISLGTYDFLAGDWDVVLISNQGTTAHVIADAVQLIPQGTAPKNSTPSPEKSERTQAQLAALKTELKSLREAGSPSAMVIAAEEAPGPADIPIALRGNAHESGPKAPRGFIKILQTTPTPVIAPKSSGRMELANWIADPNNPLTARVFVNRVWHHLFGRGIVKSVDNFGQMGDSPSNPDLLDYLSTLFIEEGWSPKKLVRKIVLSRAYQLSSSSAPSQASSDIENLLHWRQNHRRLQAEAIRDSILSVSGALDGRLGGNTVKPGTKTEYGYQFGGTRRSIYTPVFRNTLPELMQVFDFADPNLVTGIRTTSSVPTQALFMMNNPFVQKQANLAADRLLKESLSGEKSRIEYTYLLVLGRLPTTREERILLDYLQINKNSKESWSQVFQSLFASLDFRHLH